MLHQRKPVARKADTITVHVPNGAPGCTDPVRVSRREMNALIESGDFPNSMYPTVRAYLRANRAAGE
jgi:hypothetical protein